MADKKKPVRMPDMADALVAQGRMPRQLAEYWSDEINWRSDGAFRKCMRELAQHGVPLHMVNGACGNLKKRAGVTRAEVD